MTKKHFTIPSAIALCLAFVLFTGCIDRSGNVVLSPSPTVSPSTADLAPVSPSLTPLLQEAPEIDSNTIPEPMDNDNAAQNSQSAQLEEARTLSAAAENILGIEEAAVVVTDDKKCIVALKLKTGTALDSNIQNEIATVANKDTQYRITADKTIFEKIKTLEQGMETGKSVTFDEVKDAWDKIQIASK